jgi:nitrate reductase NapE
MENSSSETQERRAFLLLVVFLAPILSFMIVGGYGFIVWMSQLIFGAPGG